MSNLQAVSKEVEERDKKLGETFDLISKTLVTRIASPECSAADLGQAIKWMEYNRVTCDTIKNKALKDLQKAMADKLPKFDDEDGEQVIPFKRAE